VLYTLIALKQVHPHQLKLNQPLTAEIYGEVQVLVVALMEFLNQPCANLT
jgi:hypothetical protein